MQRTDFSEFACSIARTLDVVGEPWTPLILRDIWVGLRRFDEIQSDLGISRKVLAERLKWLAECEVVARREYSHTPPRSEYVLTDKGAQLCDLLLVMAGWGDRWTAGEAGPPVLYRHRDCGSISHAELRCSACGGAMSVNTIDVLPGPGAPRASASVNLS
jgi:DNA-binding HxlR family transcriptional regulator